MTTFSLSQTFAFCPKCSLKTPIVPGPQMSCVIRMSTSIQTFSPGWTWFFLDFAAKIFSVSVIAILFYRSHQTLDRARGIRVFFLLDSSRLKSKPSRLHRELHALRHLDRVFRAGNRGIHQNAIRSQLHRDRRVRGGTYTRIDDHGDLHFFDDELDIQAV